MTTGMTTGSQRWAVLAGLLILGWLLYLLAPVLTPFMIAATLAYLADPLVDRLQARRIPRTLGVIVVFALLTVLGIAFIIILIPVLQRQAAALVALVPKAANWFQTFVLPRLAELGLDVSTFNVESLQQAMVGHWQQVGTAITRVLAEVTQSGQTLLTWLVYLLLIPVVTFYLLRDWDVMVSRIHGLIPRRNEARVVELARECDQVLAQFLRGQLMVMAGLAVIYTTGLWMVGLDSAFLIGVVSGLVSFVPYLGFIVGIVLAGFAALIQFNELLPLVWVVAVFGVGQMVEGMILSPLLVGDRIGLHPVAVIFAVMAGGQLFGFFGILLALPVAAMVLVVLRHWHELYMQSAFYTP